jgi:hypothetical protein
MQVLKNQNNSGFESLTRLGLIRSTNFINNKKTQQY